MTGRGAVDLEQVLRYSGLAQSMILIGEIFRAIRLESFKSAIRKARSRPSSIKSTCRSEKSILKFRSGCSFEVEKLTIGVVVANQKTSLFVMVHMKEQVLHPKPSHLKNLEPLIYVNVSKQKHHLIVMGLMNQSNNEWENRYQQGQTGWDRGDVSPNLLHWLESAILKPCRILVPGCGNGHEVVTLAEKGFEVVAIDIAPTPIENLRKILKAKPLNAELIQTDFFTWELDKPFDAIYEQTSLCALHPDEWVEYEKCLFNWLKPKGKLFAQFMHTGEERGPPFHCDIPAMTELFVAQRWLWSEQHKTEVIHSDNKYEKIYLLE